MHAFQMHVQPLKGEEAVRVGRDIHRKIAHHLGRDPACTQLQPRKGFLIHDHDIRAAAAQLPRCRGARGTAAHDHDVAGAHEA